jgi:FG-GAP repeat/Secretion system C-terminal sorting domain
MKTRMLIFTFLFSISFLIADDVSELQKLVASDRGIHDAFGYAVSISGDYAIVGAHVKDVTKADGEILTDAGAAYIYMRDGTSWIQQSKLIASDPVSNQQFGRSVSISGDYAVVGTSPQWDDEYYMEQIGKVYIFKRNDNIWSQVKCLTHYEWWGSTGFGKSVSISGDYLVVGNMYYGDYYNNEYSIGAAYVYRRSGSNWYKTTIIPTDAFNNDCFGYSVYISGDQLIVGAKYADDNGAAYIFKLENDVWNQKAKLAPSDIASSDDFAYSVAISGNYAVVGAPKHNSKHGAVYVYKLNDTHWYQQQKLTASDLAAGYFGQSVSISGERALVGSYHGESAYMFVNAGHTWIEENIIRSSDGIDEDCFGFASFLSDETYIIGAYHEDEDSEGENTFESSGSAYVYEVNTAPSTFSLLSPDQSGTINILDPVFIWTASSDPNLLDTLKYTLFLESSLQSYEIEIIEDTIFTAPFDLADNMKYRWKVVVRDRAGATMENDEGFCSFIVNVSNDRPSKAKPTIPQDLIITLNPKFSWEASSDPDPNDSINYTMILWNENFRDSVLCDTNFCISNKTLDDNAFYSWTVLTQDLHSAYVFSDTMEFRTDVRPEAPAAFCTLSPVNEAVLNNSPVTFTWERSIDPDPLDTITYILYLGSLEFGIHEYSVVDDTSYTLSPELIDNSEYYWKVSALDRNGNMVENTSGYKKFTLNKSNETPSQAIPVAPDSVIILTLAPKFIWEEANDPDVNDTITYTMIIWNDSKRDTIVTDSNKCYANVPLSDNTAYVWKVEASDQHGSSSYSKKVQFWTDMHPEPPATFKTLSPYNGETFENTLVTLIWEETHDPDPLDKVSYRLKYRSTHSDSSLWHEVDLGPDTSLALDLALGNQYEWHVIASDDDGFEVMSDSSDLRFFVVGETSSVESGGLPGEFVLEQNYPNPFNPLTTISYQLSADGEIELSIYNMTGNIIKTLVNGMQNAGHYSVKFDAGDLPSGVYLYRLHAGGFVDIKKMILMK